MQEASLARPKFELAVRRGLIWTTALALSAGAAFAQAPAPAPSPRPSAAQPPPPRPPPIVRAAIDKLNGACVAAGGRPAAAPYVFVHDMTGDGRPDFLIDEGAYPCAGRPNLLRSPAGAFIEIFVVDAGGGAASAFRSRVGAFKIERGKTAQIHVGYKGAACGRTAGPSGGCVGPLAWNPAARKFSPRLGPLQAATVAPKPPAPK